MANATTNPEWKDYPDTSTLITASALNNIEEALNEASAGASVLGGLTDLESERGLRAMRVALESGTARIVAMGDSKTEGAGVSAIGDRWLNVLQDSLRARYSTADTGLGYLPSFYATFYGFSTAPVIAGTHTKIDNSGGLGNRTVELALGASITWTVPAWTGGVTMPLHYMRFAGGGSIEVVTDGVVRATIATAGADASLVSNVSIPAGTTSITVRPKAATAPVRVSGIVHRTSTSGIIVYDGARSGAIAADYTGGRGTNPQSDELHWQAVSAVDPHGIIMAFGANDQSDPPGGRTVEEWQDDVGDLFTRAKAAAPAAGLVLLVGAQRTEEAGDPTRIRAFEQAAREAVSDRPNSTILYESRLWSPIIGEDYADGDGIWLSDTVHLNAVGSRAVGLYLAGEISSNGEWVVERVTDTGWRDVTSLLVADWQASPTIGRVLMRREGSVVEVDARLAPTGANVGRVRTADSPLLAYPAGFNPRNPYSLAGQWMVYNSPLNGLLRHSGGQLVTQQPSYATPGTWQASDLVIVSARWTTADPWPSTLPGTPA